MINLPCAKIIKVMNRLSYGKKPIARIVLDIDTEKLLSDVIPLLSSMVSKEKTLAVTISERPNDTTLEIFK